MYVFVINGDFISLGANLKLSTFDNSQMNGVNLRLASLKGACLRSCNLRYAIMAGTDMEVYAKYEYIPHYVYTVQ